MPVMTRNMKNLFNQSVEFYNKSTDFVEKDFNEKIFTTQMKKLLYDCECTIGKEKKMIISIKIFEMVNDKLEKLLLNNKFKWYKFAATVYNKSCEFYDDMNSGKFNEIANKNLVKKHCQEFMKTKKNLAIYLKNLFTSASPNLIEWKHIQIERALTNLERENSFRPKRNIRIVNYIGMDTIEPRDENENIWTDYSIYEDPDYIYEEEDEDEEEYEEYEGEYEEYEEDNEDEEENISSTRQKRNIKRVNYSGMDIGEEDEGTISVCKVKWQNRIPTYRWIKYPISKINEIGDEEWQDEN
jgi:hypothetical protein